MSKARFSAWSDVYVYADVGGWVECCMCSIQEDCTQLRSVKEAIEHMRDHQAAGDKVPSHLFEEDTYDADDFKPWPTP